MSVKHIGLVLDHLNVPACMKLVAIILADHADSDGICWPGYRRVSERAGISERSVRRHISDLIELGVLVKLRNGTTVTENGRSFRITNAYKLQESVLMDMPSLLSTGDLWTTSGKPW